MTSNNYNPHRFVNPPNSYSVLVPPNNSLPVTDSLINRPPPSYASAIRLHYKGQPYITDEDIELFTRENRASFAGEEDTMNLLKYSLKVICTLLVVSCFLNIFTAIIFYYY